MATDAAAPRCTDAPASPGEASGTAAGGSRRRYRDSKPAVIGLVLIAAYGLAILVSARGAAHANTGDTNNLVKGAGAALRCLADGEFVGCCHVADGQTGVFPYPLLQYLPAAVFHLLGMSDATALGALVFLNTVAVAAVLVLALRIFKDKPRVGLLAVAVLIGSSLMYQANAAFGEPLAALAVLGVVYAACRQRPALLAACVFVACLAKETLPPLVVVLALALARDSGGRILPRRGMLWPVIAAGVLGFAANAAFNVFRFGTPRNLNYLDPSLQTRDLETKARFFVDLWVSPSAGVFWYWTAGALVLVTSAVVTLVWAFWRPRSYRSWISPLVVVVVLAVGIGGLAAWYSPFGWITYGPRLAVPLLPALIVASLVYYGEPIVAAVSRFKAVAALAVVAIVAMSVPQYSAPWRWGAALTALATGSPPCPSMEHVIIQVDAAEYYRCTIATMERFTPSPLHGGLEFSSKAGFPLWLLAAFGVGLVLVAAFFPPKAWTVAGGAGRASRAVGVRDADD